MEPKVDPFSDVEIVGHLPKKFLYRGNSYERDKLTKEQVDGMAKDKKFHAIRAKVPVPKKEDPKGDDKK